MEYFHTLKDSDIFDDPLPEPEEYIDRPTAKGLVIDESNKIALIFANGYGLLPGGGIEIGETPEEAFVRECKEEIGCDIKIISSIGTAAQFRAKQQRRYVVYFFLAKVVGKKGNPTTTQEGELECEVKWLTPLEIRESFLELVNWLPQDAYYQTNFNARTHLAAFEKYMKDKN